MARPGQYLERPTVIPGAAGPIEGLFHDGPKAPSVVVAPPDPMDGGSMEVTVVAELAWAITRGGHATLRFNYRGVGASAGRYEATTASADLDAAEAHLREGRSEPEAPIGLCGVGLGADLVLDRIQDDPERYAAGLAVAPRRLPASLPVGGPPWLVVFGQFDDSEVARDLAGRDDLGAGRLIRIPRADPAFRRGLVELGRIAVEAFLPSAVLVEFQPSSPGHGPKNPD